jgi:hypothetical protein
LISRQKGLTLDNLISANVVLSNGTEVTASLTQNSDLFWSLRGAGSAFGVVTSFTFKTFDAPENNIVFKYSLSPANAAELADFLATLQNFTMTSQPAELNMRWFLPQELSGVYYGNRTQIMSPLLAKLKVTSSGTVSVKGWIDTLLSFSNGALAQPEVYDYHETFYAKSLMPDYLPPAALTALSNYYFNTARNIGRAWYLLLDMHGGANSAVSGVSADATAYAHRNATFKMQFYDIGFGSYNSQWFPFMQNWVKAIQDASPKQNFGMYINYADTQLSKDDAHKYYFKEHYSKLVNLKTKYDPSLLFSGPQLVGS